MSKFEVIYGGERWNRILDMFSQNDVYYHFEYVRALQLHGDGQPLLIYFQGTKSRMCYVVMKRDISSDIKFKCYLNNHELYDLETPYGYGGPLVEGDFDSDEESTFWLYMNSFCEEEKIVSQFIRFHPLLRNDLYFRELDKKNTIKSTVSIDTSDKESIIKNMDTKNRNMLRKALKHEVEIVSDKGDRFRQFIAIYNESMRDHNASDYYYFNDEYYQYLINHYSGHFMFLYAVYHHTPVSGAMFLFTDKFMHYHLSGTVREYRPLASMNLLLYQAALWACDRGIKKLHLGGGMSDNDSLFGFKKQFNKNGIVPFYIGGRIFDQSKYDYLLELRKQNDVTFDKDNNFVIQYRR